MGKETVTFRVDKDTRKTLDVIAASIDRDRSYVLNEAVKAYVDAHQWQVEHIMRGVKQADAGKFASEAEVKKAFARWRK
jgi:predicted transcriptional regulator